MTLDYRTMYPDELWARNPQFPDYFSHVEGRVGWSDQPDTEVHSQREMDDMGETLRHRTQGGA